MFEIQRNTIRLVVAITAPLVAAGAAWSAAPDAMAIGRTKYEPCAACHGSDGRSTVVAQYPKIGGQSAAYVVNALKAYRDGRRQGTFAAMMSEVAKSLSDADIEALAIYVESLGTEH
jgi:cytochrome c553